MSITVHLPDGAALQLDDGASGADAAAAIGAGLARAALAIEVTGNGAQQGAEVVDLSRALPDDAHIAIITQRSGDNALALIRHDAAHVLATAVTELYPGVKVAIGPAIDNGFYYDFDFPDGVSISDGDLPAIEEKMREHVRAAETFVRSDVSVQAARERFVAEQQDYKVELIDDLVKAADPEHPLTTVSLYENGPFVDLCRGPHAPSTATVKAFKLQSVAGAYWRGDSTRPMLTRIYGTAFFSQRDLDEYLERLEQARARDHRKLGRELGLFTFSDVAPGSAFWLPPGTVIFNELVALSREMGIERGYSEVKTPQLYDSQLWKTSGHWGKYREHMFVTEAEERQMGVKPMNCPGHAHLFSLSQWSYRDLPVRYSEPGLLHRKEPSGTLHGLLRVRHFAQDDAHIFATEDQIFDEVSGCLDFAFDTYAAFGFDNVQVELSTRPEQRMGSDELWDAAEAALAGALERKGIKYDLNVGDGAFYGPKIDLHLTDSLGRSWQLGTVQLDYSMPRQFGLTYTGADNAEHVPVMIHRALMGSYERFVGILLEHTAGELPLWLAPIHALVLPISDRHIPAAQAVQQQLRAAGLRVDVDARTESMGRKVRDAELRKVRYMLVVGDREAEEGTVSVRERHGADTGVEGVQALADRLSEHVRARRQ